jgi:hypothetical protein
MTKTQIAADVERGLQLRQQIKTLTAELKGIEKRLEQAGLEGEQIPLQEEDREGRQFLARGGNVVVPVVFESDQLIASFKPGSDVEAKILRAFPASNVVPGLAGFYEAETTFSRVPKDGLAFRRLAREALGTEAPAFVAACLQRDKTGAAKSRTVIAWDNAKHPDEVPA